MFRAEDVVAKFVGSSYDDGAITQFCCTRVETWSRNVVSFLHIVTSIDEEKDYIGRRVPRCRARVLK